jgi:hypothetical protein
VSQKESNSELTSTLPSARALKSPGIHSNPAVTATTTVTAAAKPSHAITRRALRPQPAALHPRSPAGRQRATQQASDRSDSMKIAIPTITGSRFEQGYEGSFDSCSVLAYSR